MNKKKLIYLLAQNITFFLFISQRKMNKKKLIYLLTQNITFFLFISQRKMNKKKLNNKVFNILQNNYI